MTATRMMANQQTTITTLRRFLDSEAVKGQIKKALPRGMTADRLLRQAMTLIQRNPGLLKCSQISIVSGIMQAAELGLELSGVLGQAYLVPRWSKKAQCTEANFQIGYRGLAELAFRSGQVSAMPVRTVHRNDKFEMEYGTSQRLYHVPTIDADPGDVLGYYAAVMMKGGGGDFEFMSLVQMAEHRRRYSPPVEGRPSTWDTNFDEMALKTVLRRLCKRVPMCAEAQRVAVEDEYEEVVPGFTTMEREHGVAELESKADEQEALTYIEAEETAPEVEGKSEGE